MYEVRPLNSCMLKDASVIWGMHFSWPCLWYLRFIGYRNAQRMARVKISYTFLSSPQATYTKGREQPPRYEHPFLPRTLNRIIISKWGRYPNPNGTSYYRQLVFCREILTTSFLSIPFFLKHVTSLKRRFSSSHINSYSSTQMAI